MKKNKLEEKYINAFIEYIKEHPYYGHILYKYYRTLKCSKNLSYQNFNHWFNQNKYGEIENIVIKHRGIIDKKLEDDMKIHRKNESLRTDRLPSLESLVTYEGLFDET